MAPPSGKPRPPAEPAAPAPAQQSAVAEPVDAEPTVTYLERPGQWEFVDEVPTFDQVRQRLATLPPVWGVRHEDYADFIQALPSEKKVKVRRGATKVQESLDIVTVYMSVAGRIQMCRDAQERNSWRVEFVPEEVTPSGAPPGYIRWDERLVYRVWVVIHEPGPGPDGYQLLGRRSGTAWVPSTGGHAAAGSNPYEKVETSALGRALAGWGFGVLPGSGVASYEEMVSAAQNAIAVRSGATEPAPRQNQADLIQTVLERANRITELRGESELDMFNRLSTMVAKRYGVDIATARDQDGKAIGVDLQRMRPAQLRLYADALGQQLAAIQAELVEQRQDQAAAGAGDDPA